MTKPQTTDEILDMAEVIPEYTEGQEPYKSNGRKLFKHQLLDYLLALPELQDQQGIRKGSPEHVNGSVCPECGYSYISELGGCICAVDNELRYRIVEALTRAILGEEEAK